MHIMNTYIKYHFTLNNKIEDIALRKCSKNEECGKSLKSLIKCPLHFLKQ